MDRIIKFKVMNGPIHCVTEWLSEEGWKHLLLNNGQIKPGVFNEFSYGHEKALPRLQFTGAYDSTKWNDKELSAGQMEEFVSNGGKPSEWKGIEIFEGDIIEGYYKTKYVVSHSDYDLSFIGVSNDGDDYGPYTLRLSAKGTKRVIGNIHTNPELLTQK